LIKAILQDNTSLKRKEYFAITHFLFLIIFCFNLIGLIPFSFTLTSNIVVTLFLASVHFLSINLLGFYKKGIKMVDLFVPSGLPLLLVPFLIIIELISYLAKVVSLSVRLFANMMSGHALLKILIGFS
jgi:F-type H+-transporting ATPase subunit a